MKVLFINPHYPMPVCSVLLHPPLAYAYMAAELKRRGNDVLCLDLPMRTNNILDETAFIQSYNPDIVGVTSVTQNYCQALEIARFSKQLMPYVPVVLGGPHVTFTPQETLLRHQCVDFVMMFDSDIAFADLVELLNQRDYGRLSRVPGLAYRPSDSRDIRFGASPPKYTSTCKTCHVNAAPILEMNLDVYPIPDRSIFDIQSYLNRDYETVIMSARGCPSRCSFCSTTQMGRRYRHHGVQRIVDEFEYMLGLGFHSFFIGDDTFPASFEHTVAVCREIVRRQLQFEWTCNMRILDARPAILEAMKGAGAYRVFTGIETIKNDSLRTIRKGTTVEKIRTAVKNVKAAGLEMHSAFIIGVPGDTNEDLRCTLDFIREIQPTVATFNTMEARPGTDMFKNPSKYGLSIPDPYWYEGTGWMELPTCHTDQLSREQIKHWVQRCYYEFCSGMFGGTLGVRSQEPDFDKGANEETAFLAI